MADRLALYDHLTRVTSQQKEQAEASNNEDLYIDLVAKLKKGTSVYFKQDKLQTCNCQLHAAYNLMSLIKISLTDGIFTFLHSCKLQSIQWVRFVFVYR